MMLTCTRTRTKFLRRMVLLVPFLASGHAGLVQRAGTQWWPPGLHGQRHTNTWMYQSLADEAVGAIPLDARSKNMKQL